MIKHLKITLSLLLFPAALALFSNAPDVNATNQSGSVTVRVVQYSPNTTPGSHDYRIQINTGASSVASLDLYGTFDGTVDTPAITGTTITGFDDVSTQIDASGSLSMSRFAPFSNPQYSTDNRWVDLASITVNVAEGETVSFVPNNVISASYDSSTYADILLPVENFSRTYNSIVPTNTQAPTPTNTQAPTPPTGGSVSLDMTFRIESVTTNVAASDFEFMLMNTDLTQKVEGTDRTLTLAPDANGVYTTGTLQLDVAPGTYGVCLKADTHLRKCFVESLTATTSLTKSAVSADMLTAGDVARLSGEGRAVAGGDNVIDASDLAFVAGAYTSFSTPVTASNRLADINRDGFIDIQDFALISMNYTGFFIPGDGPEIVYEIAQ